MATFIFYTTGGTANYGYARLIISTSSGGGPVFALNGREASSQKAGHTNLSTDGISNFSKTIWYTLPAGSYYALMQYQMDVGATTTLSWLAGETQVFVVG
jgi:hypothetical protein